MGKMRYVLHGLLLGFLNLPFPSPNVKRMFKKIVCCNGGHYILVFQFEN